MPPSEPIRGTPPERLRKNAGCYCGETIAIDSICSEIDQAAGRHGWECLTFFEADDSVLRAYRRLPPAPRKRLYLSTGIHGDEPAGPLTILGLVRRNHWPDDLAIWLCPCLNPAGFRLNRRENEYGIDLNRDYRHLHTPTVRAHTQWLEALPAFDLTVLLHEDWEASGFYLYELNPDQLPSPAESIIRAVSAVCPIDTAEKIDGWTAREGIIRPQVDPRDRLQWAEAVYLVARKTRHSITLEAPSDFPMEVRVAALTLGLQTVLEWLAGAE